MVIRSYRKIWYYYDENIGNFYYGPGHPMKPQVVRMTHHLIKAFCLDKKMACFRPNVPFSAEDMTRFHSDEYIQLLEDIDEKSFDEISNRLWKYNIGNYCPLFKGLFEYCQSYTTGSLYGAQKLNLKLADIVINWSGGMSHSKKAYCVGFAPINDTVLAILELLKHHNRVIYIDIDAQHCSGVEEAFYTSNKVITLSFHSYDKDKFPSTGHIDDIGYDSGKGYSINVPLKSGADDSTFDYLFEPITLNVIQKFKPNVIVYKSGANSLAGDRLENMNLSLQRHGKCLNFINSFDLPMLVLGGSGATLRNVTRCWTYETAVLLGIHNKLTDYIPLHEYQEHYSPDYSLYFGQSYIINHNTNKYLNNILNKIQNNINNYVTDQILNNKITERSISAEKISNIKSTQSINNNNIKSILTPI